MRGWLLALLLLCGWGAVAQAEPTAIPALSARVTDLTGTLDAQQRGQLEQQLAALEQRKGAQLAVLMIPSTGEDSIEQYAVRAFEQWKLGRKGVDDGALLVVAKDDRALRIEVGYGLEGAVTDALAGRIIREQMVPRFQQGDFAGGVQAGVDSLEKLIDGEALPEPSHTANGGQPDVPGDPLAWLFVLTIGVPVLGNLFGARRTPGAKVGRSLLYSLVVGALAGVGSLAFGGGAAQALVNGGIGVGFALMVYLFLAFGGRGGGGGFGGGRGGGFGGGGGGFSGGGGSSGGGGASGRW
ncbi:TPM domain-containing protein [Pseudomonas citronellolis]|uniref:TPM domain-containing protein n=1 Tax=Pseudomonas citronellolis TaxID=53408 RepID=UPI003D34F65B